jgi:DNA-binding transcriptional MerR regulator
LYTVDTALESLNKYDIRESDLRLWEKELELDIPVDEYGRKQYSPHHINLFKNIKKHLALGRTIGEIRSIINLPPLLQSRPQPVAKANTTKPTPPQTVRPQAPVMQAVQVAPGQTETTLSAPNKSAYASVPSRPASPTPHAAGGAANVVNLVQRLTREKDQLYKKLLETEKLNSHLYSANSLFHKKVREMTQQVVQLRESLNEDEKFKLMDDKARLYKQLLDIEKTALQKQDELQKQLQKSERQNEQIQMLEQQIQALSTTYDPMKFRGDWMENGTLVEVIYDNFGINIEPERVRLFRISEIPARLYGSMAIVNTSYQYETNNLWKRDETLAVAYIDENTLEGEMTAEYILDGVPVAKAVYRVTCRRNQ